MNGTKALLKVTELFSLQIPLASLVCQKIRIGSTEFCGEKSLTPLILCEHFYFGGYFKMQSLCIRKRILNDCNDYADKFHIQQERILPTRNQENILILFF